MLVLPLGCQPVPSEVETLAGGSSEGASGTTSTGSGTSTSAETTADASAGGTSSSSAGAGTVASTSGEGTEGDSTGEPMDEPLGPFGTPVLVPEFSNLYADDDPTLTGDMLEIYFGSNRSGLTEDVWMSTRADLDTPWDAPEPVTSVSSDLTESLVEVSADGLLMLLASDRLIGGDFDVYYSRRSDRSQDWPTPIPLPGAANPGPSDLGATPSPDLASVFLCRAPSGFADVYEAPVDFGTPLVGRAVLVTELLSAQHDCSVSLSVSGREIFVESDRPTTTFGWNLWVSMREDVEGVWEPPVPVTELNTHNDDIDPWLSPDRRTLWFASDRTGNLELYVATRR